MHPIQTLGDLLHEVNNSLGLISSYAQYLLCQREASDLAGRELHIIHEEAEQAATILTLLPKALLKVSVPATAQVSRHKMARNEGVPTGTDEGKEQL